MKFDQEYFNAMLNGLIEEERYADHGIQAIEILDDAVESIGVSVSDSGDSEITLKEAIEKYSIAVIGLAIIQSIQSNASQERYIRLEQMKLQDREAAALERIGERLGNIDARLETALEKDSDAINAHDVAITLCSGLDKAAGDISHNLYTVSKDIYTLHSRIENLIFEMRGKKK
jgi:hypothetical protein